MLFNSTTFVVFFLAVYAVYLVLRHTPQNRLLLLASYLFYAWWDWRFVFLLFFTTLVDYNAARLIAGSSIPSRRRRILYLSLSVHLCALGFFKYFNFFIDSAVSLLGAANITANPVLVNVVLPVGISFYTFQSISYVVDVYRGKTPPSRNFPDYALYVSFFPQLVAGPIERFAHQIPQIAGPRTITRNDVGEGLWLILFGYYKKVVVADNLALLTGPVFDAPGDHAGLAIVTAIYAYALQIYCDFSGYTDIARGTAKLFGIHLSINFNLPYFARDPADFWRRWHISLSTWLRDYLYIPLGGNRYGALNTGRNLMITMLLGGLWHGPAWHFVSWGGYHGLLLIFYRWLATVRTSGTPTGYPLTDMLLMFHLTCLGWVIFRTGDITDITVILCGLFSPGVPDISGMLVVLIMAGPLLAIDTIQYRNAKPDFILHTGFATRLAVHLILLAYILLFGKVDGYEFIYFQF